MKRAIAVAAGLLTLAASALFADEPARPVVAKPVVASKPVFTPRPDSAIPDDEFGRMVRLGEAIFTDTGAHAGAYVGNSLRCSNCHLDAGRLADSAPLAQAYVLYPAYRSRPVR